jgi:cysteinyl-tRNA synthetase
MNDDFNTPILIAKLFEAVKIIHAIKNGQQTINSADHKLLSAAMNSFVFDVLGLEKIKGDNDESLDALMELVVDMRKSARENKDWDTADAIREKLKEAGIEVKDGKDGVTWSKL